MRPSEILPFLSHAIKHKENILLTGEPGIGKTDVVKQASQLANTILHITHPVIHGPEDYIGFPMIINNEPLMVPFKDLRVLIDAKVPTTYFLDDLGQAAPATQKALMQLLWERRIGNNDVSPHISFVAATNRRKDRAGVSGILETVKSRMTIIPFQPNIDDWISWGIDNDMPPLLLAFHRFRPDLLFQFKATADITNSPCPRTVAKVGDWINNGAIDVDKFSALSTKAHADGTLSKATASEENINRDSERNIPSALQGLEFEIVTGCCGEGYAIEFLSFARVHQDMPDINSIIKHPDSTEVPSMDRPDVLYATISALVSRTDIKNIENIFKYVNRIPVEFATLYVTDMARKDNEVCVESKGFIDWCDNNRKAII